MDYNFKRCSICNEMHWTDEKCKPIYEVYHRDYAGDEPFRIRANSHAEAAEKYAEEYNCDGDYALMNDTIDVEVKKNGERKYFRVGAEPDVHYFSNELTPQEGR